MMMMMDGDKNNGIILHANTARFVSFHCTWLSVGDKKGFVSVNERR
jgi:hypothetical protein